MEDLEFKLQPPQKKKKKSIKRKDVPIQNKFKSILKNIQNRILLDHFDVICENR